MVCRQPSNEIPTTPKNTTTPTKKRKVLILLRVLCTVMRRKEGLHRSTVKLRGNTAQDDVFMFRGVDYKGIFVCNNILIEIVFPRGVMYYANYISGAALAPLTTRAIKPVKHCIIPSAFFIQF